MPRQKRRDLLRHLCVAAPLAGLGLRGRAEPVPDPRWYQAALAMKELALSWGDQPYGAVLVLDGRIVGDGPSRVLRNRDDNAHAEREAIRDARLRLGRSQLHGSLLVSTSRPCGACEAAAAAAGVARMYHGPTLIDAGVPGGLAADPAAVSSPPRPRAAP